ncbi:MAG TPA: peptidoglycan-binding domain-containing protein [Chthoniobacterales bacterium]|jgi:hypothetical protein
MKMTLLSKLMMAGVLMTFVSPDLQADDDRKERRPSPSRLLNDLRDRSPLHQAIRGDRDDDRRERRRDDDSRREERRRDYDRDHDREERKNVSRRSDRRYRYGYPYRRDYYGYDYGYGYPYYSRPRTTIAIGVTPTYYSGTVYRAERASGNSVSLEVAVQRKLAKEGYYHGPIDGDIGPASRSAIARFQQDNDLDVTGRINKELIEELDLD